MRILNTGISLPWQEFLCCALLDAFPSARIMFADSTWRHFHSADWDNSVSRGHVRPIGPDGEGLVGVTVSAPGKGEQRRFDLSLSLERGSFRSFLEKWS